MNFQNNLVKNITVHVIKRISINMIDGNLSFLFHLLCVFILWTRKAEAMMLSVATLTLEKGMASFHAIAELKQTAQPKNVMSQMYMGKEVRQIVKRA